MAREQDEREGISGGRFVPAANNLLPPTRPYRLSRQGDPYNAYPIEQVGRYPLSPEESGLYPLTASISAGIVSATGSLSNVRFVSPTAPSLTITEAAPGQDIILLVDYNVTGVTNEWYNFGWKVTVTAIEVDASNAIVPGGWNSYVGMNQQYSGNANGTAALTLTTTSKAMPAHALKARIKLWVYGSTANEAPPVSPSNSGDTSW
jgi:hypothetical protein